MNNIFDKIKDIKWDKNHYYIYCNKNNLKLKIIDGVVDIEVRNSENKYIGFHLLEKNDIIKIKYNNLDNDFIYPKIILINTKYTFYNDYSDEE
jgi:hypothetical protein